MKINCDGCGKQVIHLACLPQYGSHGSQCYVSYSEQPNDHYGICKQCEENSIDPAGHDGSKEWQWLLDHNETVAQFGRGERIDWIETNGELLTR